MRTCMVSHSPPDSLPSRLLYAWDSPTPGDLPNLGIEPRILCLLHWQASSSPRALPGKPCVLHQGIGQPGGHSGHIWMDGCCRHLVSGDQRGHSTSFSSQNSPRNKESSDSNVSCAEVVKFGIRRGSEEG